MVNLTRIYTRTGDEGRTRLSDLSETSKTDPRVEAYGDVDEANAVLGLVVTAEGLPDDVRDVILHVQNELFDAGADLSRPPRDDRPGVRRLTPDYVTRLEEWCDRYNAGLPPLRSFVLAGGTQAAALLHLARTVVRRAERAAWRVPDGVNPVVPAYLNRLSDLLFILARVAAQPVGETLWVPFADRPLTGRPTTGAPPAGPPPAS